MPNARRVALLLALAACVPPSPALAWGAGAHRFIMRRAIEALPPPLKPLFAANADELAMRVVDPDLWRNAGWDEEPNHFMNFGAPELGPYPFVALPREYGAAIEKFGMTTLKRLGLLPWREQEEFGNLRRAFEGFARGQRYAANDAVLFSAVAAHYIEDAYQPLHATINYDGQMTAQRGVHARFETTLFNRFERRLVITAPSGPRSGTRGMPPSRSSWRAIRRRTRSSQPTSRRTPAGTCTTIRTTRSSSVR